MGVKSEGEELLAVQLEQAGIDFLREYEFHPTRKWRADFRVFGPPINLNPDILVEIEGGAYTGGHKRGKAYESDCDKQNEAVRMGFRVLRFTPAHVRDGRAIATIQRMLED